MDTRCFTFSVRIDKKETRNIQTDFAETSPQENNGSEPSLSLFSWSWMTIQKKPVQQNLSLLLQKNYIGFQGSDFFLLRWTLFKVSSILKDFLLFQQPGCVRLSWQCEFGPVPHVLSARLLPILMPFLLGGNNDYWALRVALGLAKWGFVNLVSPFPNILPLRLMTECKKQKGGDATFKIQITRA